MPKWTSRSSTVFALLLLLTASAARAQQVDILSDQEPQAPATPAQDPGQKVAEGEEPAKPTRAFFPALLHDLGDDVKHMPRRNTLYWLAWGTGVSLAVHPADDYFNNHLSTSDTAKNVFLL